jgi:hypothetical protein
MEYFETITNAKTGEVTTRPYTDAEMVVVNAALADLAANGYKTARAAAYPSIADQLDTIYHEGLDAWKATILAVKEEFPKP